MFFTFITLLTVKLHVLIFLCTCVVIHDLKRAFFKSAFFLYFTSWKSPIFSVCNIKHASVHVRSAQPIQLVVHPFSLLHVLPLQLCAYTKITYLLSMCDDLSCLRAILIFCFHCLLSMCLAFTIILATATTHLGIL